MSEGLKRARAPFRVRNAITGIIVASFAVGVWAYSISAVKQDNFDDVDEEAKALVRSGLRSIEDEEKLKASIQAGHASKPPIVGIAITPSLPPVVQPARGVLVPLLEKHAPRLLDPKRKTLVWGAPPVDSI